MFLGDRPPVVEESILAILELGASNNEKERNQFFTHTKNSATKKQNKGKNVIISVRKRYKNLVRER